MVGETVMELEEKTLESIWQYVRKNLSAWLVEAGAALRPAIPAVGAGEETAVAAGYSLPGSVLLERLIRIEEELRAQRNLTEARFEAVDKRFDDLIHQMDKRFEAGGQTLLERPVGHGPGFHPYGLPDGRVQFLLKSHRT
jgi:hypothetical protein